MSKKSSSSSSSSDSSSSSEETKKPKQQENKPAETKKKSSSSSSSDSSSSSEETKKPKQEENKQAENNNKRKTFDNGNKTETKKQKTRNGAASMIKVYNLAWAVNDDVLRETFGGCGNIIRANVAMSGDKSRGFGFVEFEEEDAAQKALEFHGSSVEGREIRVEVAEIFGDDNGQERGPRKKNNHLVGYTTQVIVTNLGDIGEPSLRESLEKFGELKELRFHGEKPIAFATFYDLRHAEAAFSNGSLNIDGQDVGIDLIEPKIPNAEGGRGGGDRRGGFGGGRGGDRGGDRRGGFGGGRGGGRGGFGGGRGGDRGGGRSFGGGRGGGRGGFGGGNKFGGSGKITKF